MNQRGKNEINRLVERYIALWNEPDAEKRNKTISELWTEDGAQFLPSQTFRGQRALIERVSSAHEEFVKAGGFLFKQLGEADALHDAVKFTWEMVPATGGAAAASGLIFLILSDDGRIRLDYQF